MCIMFTTYYVFSGMFDSCCRMSFFFFNIHIFQIIFCHDIIKYTYVYIYIYMSYVVYSFYMLFVI